MRSRRSAHDALRFLHQLLRRDCHSLFVGRFGWVLGHLQDGAFRDLLDRYASHIDGFDLCQFCRGEVVVASPCYT